MKFIIKIYFTWIKIYVRWKYRMDKNLGWKMGVSLCNVSMLCQMKSKYVVVLDEIKISFATMWNANFAIEANDEEKRSVRNCQVSTIYLIYNK